MGKGKGWESDSVMLHTSPVKLLLLDESSPLSGETSSKSSSSVPKFPVLISSALVFNAACLGWLPPCRRAFSLPELLAGPRRQRCNWKRA